MLAELDPKTKSQPNNTGEGATPIFMIFMAGQPIRLLTISFPYKALLNSYFWGGGTFFWKGKLTSHEILHRFSTRHQVPLEDDEISCL